MQSDSAAESKVTLTVGGSTTERDKDGSCAVAGRRLLIELESVGLSVVGVLTVVEDEETLLSAAVVGTRQDANGTGLDESVGCRAAAGDWRGRTEAECKGM